MQIRQVACFGALTLTFILGAALAPIRPAEGKRSNSNNEMHIGLRIAPVPLDFSGKNKRLVGLGSYIVNAQSGCNDCHTNPSYTEGHDPFEGEPEQINAEHYLAGGRPFGPFITSRNITPDANGKPAGLTRSEFIRTLRTGHDEEEEPLLQVMPWPVFGKMTDDDLKAIYEYLRAIPHADPAPQG